MNLNELRWQTWEDISPFTSPYITYVSYTSASEIWPLVQYVVGSLVGGKNVWTPPKQLPQLLNVVCRMSPFSERALDILIGHILHQRLTRSTMNESIWCQPMVSHKITNYDHNIYTYAGANSINSCIQLNSSPEPRTHQRNRLVYVQWNAWFAHLSGNHLIQFGLVWNVRFLKTVPAEGERIKKHTGQRRSGKKLPPMKTTFLSMLSQ